MSAVLSVSLRKLVLGKAWGESSLAYSCCGLYLSLSLISLSPGFNLSLDLSCNFKLGLSLNFNLGLNLSLNLSLSLSLKS